MANGTIRGITIEFGGDTTKLGKALDAIRKNGKQVDAALKDVNKSLKFDPKNTELLSQKQSLLGKKIEETKQRLDVLKQAQATMDASGVDQSSDEYMKLRRQIMQAEGQLGAYETQLRRVDSAMRNEQSASEKLGGTISDQERELSALKDAYKNYIIEGNGASDAAKELEAKIEALSGNLAENRTRMQTAEMEADRFDHSMENAADAVAEASDAAADSGGGFSIMKGAMADLVSAGIQKTISAVKDFAAAVAGAYAEFDDGADTIIEKTGATGDALAGLSDSYMAVSDEFLGDFEDIGTAVGEVNTRFGVTGSKLEDLSAKFLKFAELNDTDVNNSIDNVQKTMSAWGLGAEDAGGLLDALNKVGQDTGISMDTLSGYLMENASTFKQLGLDVYQAAGYLGTLEKSGVSTSTAMTALQKANTYSAKSGKTLTETLSETADKMKKSKSEAEALQIAYDVFGKKAGAKIAEGLKTGTISFDDLSAAMQNSSGSVDQTYESTQDGMDKIKLAFQGAKAEIGNTIGTFLDEHKAEIESAIQSATTAIKSVLDFVTNNKELVLGVLGGITGAVIALKLAILAANIAAMANPVGLIVAGIAAVIAVLATCYAKFEGFRNVVNSVISFVASIFNAVKPAFSAVINFIIGLVGGWINMIRAQIEFVVTLVRNGIDLAKKIFGAFKSAADAIWKGIQNVIVNPVTSAVSSVEKLFGNMKSTAINIFNAVKSKTTSIWNGIKKAIIDPIAAAKEKVGKIIDGIKGFFSNLKLKLPSFSLPKMPEFGLKWSSKTIFGKEISYPSGIDVSWHKDGGIFTSPTLLHGVGEAGAEAILPLDALWRKFDQMADSIVSGVGTVVQAAATGGGGDIRLDVYLYPNGPKMMEEIVKAYDTGKRRVGG